MFFFGLLNQVYYDLLLAIEFVVFWWVAQMFYN